MTHKVEFTGALGKKGKSVEIFYGGFDIGRREEMYLCLGHVQNLIFEAWI